MQFAPSGSIPVKIGKAAISDDALGFFEVHIEQGPVLEAEDLRVAAVTAIVGQTRHTLTWTGHANHAGTTPMHLRRDALAGAAEWIVAVESLAERTEGLVATVGHMDVEPNAGNVIAGAARVSLDVRHADDAAAQVRRRNPARAGRSHRRIGARWFCNAHARWISPPCRWTSV